jgi:short-chain fatty acids transporter
VADAAHQDSDPDPAPAKNNVLANFSQNMVNFAERWFPDAYVCVLLAVIVTAIVTIVHGGSPLAASPAFGDGFLNLIPLTMQLALVAIGATSHALIPQAQ